MTDFPDYVPKCVADVLRKLQGERDGYITNLTRFYQLRADGEFKDHVDEWVLMEHGDITGYYKDQKDIMKVKFRDPDAAFQPVDDSKLRRQKKRAIVNGADDEFRKKKDLETKRTFESCL